MLDGDVCVSVQLTEEMDVFADQNGGVVPSVVYTPSYGTEFLRRKVDSSRLPR